MRLARTIKLPAGLQSEGSFSCQLYLRLQPVHFSSKRPLTRRLKLTIGLYPGDKCRSCFAATADTRPPVGGLAHCSSESCGRCFLLSTRHFGSIS